MEAVTMAQQRKPVLILMAEDDDVYYSLTKDAFQRLRLINELRRVEDGEDVLDRNTGPPPQQADQQPGERREGGENFGIQL